jgi:hypothetical protein
MGCWRARLPQRFRHQPSASRGRAPKKLDTSNQSMQIEMRLSVAVRSPKIDSVVDRTAQDTGSDLHRVAGLVVQIAAFGGARL